MAYAILRKLGSRCDYVRIEDTILHCTEKSLGDEYPHLVRTWKTKAAAKGVQTRILNKYAPMGMYGCASDFSVVPYDRGIINL